MRSTSEVRIKFRPTSMTKRQRNSNNSALPRSRHHTPRCFFLAALILSQPYGTTSFSVSCYRRSFSVLSAVAPPERLEDSCRILASSTEDDCLLFPTQVRSEEGVQSNLEETNSEQARKPLVASTERIQRHDIAENVLRCSGTCSSPKTPVSVMVPPEASARTSNTSTTNKTSTKVTRSVIHTAIHELMEQAAQHQHESSSSSTSLSSFVGKSIGVLGDQQDWTTLKQRADLSKLTVLEDKDTLIRMASSLDDLDIANLRLSVFSDFSLQQRSQFCARSCQAIAARRKRGASCLVAVSKGGATVLGSAECSFHEFYGTQLGRRRKQHSILYVTEVAVSPSARRRGVGTNLLRAIDVLAKKRSIETLYLHVDVSNTGAIRLYERAGYKRVANAPMFLEFTQSLNLHPGATKGRDHFLFFKNLVPSPVWLDSSAELNRPRSDERRILEVFGFEIPA